MYYPPFEIRGMDYFKKIKSYMIFLLFYMYTCTNSVSLQMLSAQKFWGCTKLFFLLLYRP